VSNYAAVAVFCKKDITNAGVDASAREIWDWNSVEFANGIRTEVRLLE
jgi:hypothetical protein